MRLATFDPKDAKPHQRHNRARAALLAYKAEAGIDEWYISGVSDHSVLRGMLVDIQLMLIEREGERERRTHEAGGMQYGPYFPNHPDTAGLEFIANIGFMDIYRAGDTSSYTFIVVTGKEGGAYITTDNLLRLMPGFFDTQR